jgi:hypothetical protein
MAEEKSKGVGDRLALAAGSVAAKGSFEFMKAKVGGSTDSQAALSAGLAMFEEACDKVLFSQLSERKGKWLVSFAAAWHERTGMFEEAFREQLEEKLQDKNNQQTLYEFWVKSRDALDESVYLALGRLSVEYIGANKKPDTFFRGLGRVLADIDSEEFETLQALLAKAVGSIGEAPWIAVHASQEEVGAHWHYGVDELETTDQVTFEGIDPHRARRVLYLLDTNYLGDLVGRWGEVSSRETTLLRETLIRLRDIVNGRPTPSETTKGEDG